MTQSYKSQNMKIGIYDHSLFISEKEPWVIGSCSISLELQPILAAEVLSFQKVES